MEESEDNRDKSLAESEKPYSQSWPGLDYLGPITSNLWFNPLPVLTVEEWNTRAGRERHPLFDQYYEEEVQALLYVLDVENRGDFGLRPGGTVRSFSKSALGTWLTEAAADGVFNFYTDHTLGEDSFRELHNPGFPDNTLGMARWILDNQPDIELDTPDVFYRIEKDRSGEYLLCWVNALVSRRKRQEYYLDYQFSKYWIHPTLFTRLFQYCENAFPLSGLFAPPRSFTFRHTEEVLPEPVYWVESAPTYVSSRIKLDNGDLYLHHEAFPTVINCGYRIRKSTREEFLTSVVLASEILTLMSLVLTEGFDGRETDQSPYWDFTVASEAFLEGENPESTVYDRYIPGVRGPQIAFETFKKYVAVSNWTEASIAAKSESFAELANSGVGSLSARATLDRMELIGFDEDFSSSYPTLLLTLEGVVNPPSPRYSFFTLLCGLISSGFHEDMVEAAQEIHLVVQTWPSEEHYEPVIREFLKLLRFIESDELSEIGKSLQRAENLAPNMFVAGALSAIAKRVMGESPDEFAEIPSQSASLMPPCHMCGSPMPFDLAKFCPGCGAKQKKKN